MPSCKLNNCPVATGGRCIEALGPDCPNLIPDSSSSLPHGEISYAPKASHPLEPTYESLPGIAPLEVSEARHFSRRGRSIVVALTGMPDCGKTSLLARLHQLFQAGPLAGFDFAGSRTLPRFEELNWKATFESGVPEPTMEHSSAQLDNSFMHLAVRPTHGGVRVDLLLNDIAGETFNEAVEAQESCQKLVALARADHLLVLIDGAALVNPALRYHHIEQVHDFIQRVLQSGQCGTHTALHLVISKLDQLKNCEALADDMEKKFDAGFRSKVGSLAFWRVAARPMDSSNPTAEKIGELFASWVHTTHRYPFPATRSVSQEICARDFCRFGI